MRVIACLAIALVSLETHARDTRPPIIDMHMHAWSLDEFGGQSVPGCIGAEGVEMLGIDPAKPFDFSAQVDCKRVVQSPATDEEVLAETLAAMKRLNIVAGVIAGEGPVVAAWRKAAPDRFISAANFFTGLEAPPAAHVSTLAAQVERGETKSLRKSPRNIAAWRPMIRRWSHFTR